MNRRTPTPTALVFASSLLAMPIIAAAQSPNPELTEKELVRHCDAALRDLRTYCSAEIRPQGYSVPMELNELLPVQQPAPNPGSERPALPGSKENFDCLDARLRVDRYCYREKPATGDKVVFSID